MHKAQNSVRPVVGIGACLAGNAVRYDGKENKNKCIRTHLEKTLNLRAFCPEMGIGLPVPRPPIHIVHYNANNAVLDSQTHQIDYSQSLRRYAVKTLKENPDLCGYVMVKGSPSCGLAGVKRFNFDGQEMARDATGLFAQQMQSIDPLLPFIEDESLNDEEIRNSFVNAVYAYRDWQSLSVQGMSLQNIVDFYSRYKYLVMIRDMECYHYMQDLLNNLANSAHPPVNIQLAADQLIQMLLTALKLPATTDPLKCGQMDTILADG